MESHLLALQTRVREFIARDIIPLEADPRQGAHGPEESFRLELVALARNAGLLAPQVSRELGGMHLTHRERAVVFEEAGYSPLGPLAMNLFAPDEGNMHLMELIATPAQKAQFLAPLARGETRSCFAMTEPAPGAGSDPSMLQTTATRAGDDYIINGTKWFITGAMGAAFAIIMAKDSESGAVTMFLSPMIAPGIRIERAMESLDTGFPGGHCVVHFENLRIPAAQILGELGKGFHYAQLRLAPARLTHCMRWLGNVRRAHDIAVDYARTRSAFGKRIGDHEGVGFQLVDNDIDMHCARLAIAHCADVLDTGDLGLTESSRTKVIASEAVWRVADRCVQVMGGRGVTGEALVMRIFRDVRAFRIYDGPSEVHRWSLAKKIMKGS